MKRFVFLLFGFLFAFSSCEKNEEPFLTDTDQTVFIYMPWASDLLMEFTQNIHDLETGIAEKGLRNERILVFFQTSETEAKLFEIKVSQGKCTQEILQEYINPAVTKPEGITSIVKDVIRYAPAKRYGMVVSCHGMSWLPVGSTQTAKSMQLIHTESGGGLKTRYFGGKTTNFQTEISDFVEGIKNTGIKMEYILFDDCYMSSIEVAYDLKDITDYLVASPCEVMAYGMPYHIIGKYMIGTVDYESICQGIVSFYQTYKYPYVTIALTVCSELQALADVMREVNQISNTENISLHTMVQNLDGYSPTCFFDFSDYVAKLCPDEKVVQKFETQLERAVPSTCRFATDYFYTNSRGAIKLNTYSGMTISDPSVNRWTETKQKTNWYKATH